jgi:hypothetical protein
VSTPDRLTWLMTPADLPDHGELPDDIALFEQDMAAHADYLRKSNARKILPST